MARINIDDQFWLDVGEVAIGMGDYDRAVGVSLKFFRYAQEKHKHGKLISEDEFSSRFHEALIPYFAKRVDGGIQCIGAEKYFDWIEKKKSAGSLGGRASGAKRSKRKQTVANGSKPKHSEPSSSISISSSSSSSNSISISSKDGAPTLSPPANPVSIYCEAYKARYGHNPPIAGKQSGILKRFMKDHPSDGERLIRGYLSMPDAWATQRSHPVELLVSKLNEIHRFLETGRVVTQGQVKEFHEKLDQEMGPKPKSITDILNERNKAMLNGAPDEPS